MTIPFRPITIADADLLRSFTMDNKCMNCDINVANLCSWQFLYHTEFAIVEGFLLLRFLLDGKVTYMKPIGKGDLQHVLVLLQDDARKMGEALRVACVCPCAQALMEESMPGSFSFESDRNKADYIYLRERLTMLSGKKLQPKRNHVNKFKRLYPNYEYRPLTADLVPDCLRLGQEWCQTNNSHEQRAALAEQHMMTFALSHIDELQILGGTIFVDGRMVAFTFGSRINANTFDICVEKADTSYEGAYAMINNEFASHLPEDIVYVNREEDLGLEGLRKAKLSYDPELILDKMIAEYTATPTETDKECNIRFETRHLWERSFADPRAFIDLYFREKYRKERNEVILRDGRVVSALQKLPYPITYGGRMIPASYVSGACTDENYRRRGLMGELLDQTHRSMQAEGAWLGFLIPATAELVGYYSRFGYTPCFRFAWNTVTAKTPVEDIEVTQSAEVPLEYLRTRMQERPTCVQHPLSDLRAVVDDMRLTGDTLWEARRGTLIVATAICRAEDNGILLRECVYDDDIARDALIAGIAKHYGHAEVDIIDTTATQGDYLGMARIINVENMLATYANLHPEKHYVLDITDPLLTENNGCYELRDGKCRRITLTPIEAERHSIATLTDLIFAQENPLMSLMMND